MKDTTAYTTDDIEQVVLRAAEVALQTPRIRSQDDLHELGMDSLVATVIVARVHRELAVDIPVRLLLEHPVAADFARAVAERMAV